MEKKLAGFIGLLLILVLAVSVIVVIKLRSPSSPEKRIEELYGKKAVWFGVINRPWTQQQLDQALTAFKNGGIDIVFFLVKDPSGYVYFDSSYAPNSTTYDWDCLDYILKKAHEIGLKVHPYLNILEDAQLRMSHSEFGMVSEKGSMTTWVCPAYEEVREYELNVIREVVKKYDIDGIQWDRIRCPSEYGDYCYCSKCRELYKNSTGKDPTPGDPNWTKFRQGLISDFVREMYMEVTAIKPGIFVSADVFPSADTAPTEENQDWPTWAKNKWIDFVVTMAYTTSLDTLITLVNSEVQAVQGVAPLYVGLGAWRLNNSSQLKEQLQVVNASGAAGVSFFNGDSLAGNTGFLNVISNFNLSGIPDIAASVSEASVVNGKSVTVSGSVVPPKEGINVTLTYTRSDSSTVQRTVVTNSAGAFSDTYTPDAVGSWKVFASFVRDRQTVGSLSVTFTVKTS